MIKTADWIVDLGPEGGEEGGHIVAQGTPEDVAQKEVSYTGKFLKRVLQPTVMDQNKIQGGKNVLRM